MLKTNKKFYKINRGIILVAYGTFFATAIIIDFLKIRQSSIMESSIALIPLGFLLLLFGVHLLYYRQFWIDDTIQMVTKHLQGKPKWYQAWLSVRKNPQHNRIMVPLLGLFLLILSSLLLAKGFGIIK